MRKKLALIGLILSFLVMVSCGSSDANDSSKTGENTAAEDSTGQTEASEKKNGSEEKDDQEEESTAVPIEVTLLTLGNISSSLQYSSTLETEQIVDVYPRIGGLVEGIYVEEGDRVYKGQKLLQIEKEVYDLAEQKAHIEFQKQESEFKRLTALQAEELLSQEEFDRAELAFKQAEISWKESSLSLRFTTVTSPISGVVGERLVNLGDRVQTATNLFKVANLDEKIVQVYIPQDEFAQIFKKQEAKIFTGILPDQQFTGYVKRISPIIDPQSGTFKVTIAVKDQKARLRPGMFVSTELIVDNHENARLIPKSALIYENERTYFFIVENDSSRRIELQKSFEDSEKVESLNELNVGTRIVVLGQNGLKDGTPVKIIEEKRFAWQPSKPSAGVTDKGSKLTTKG